MGQSGRKLIVALIAFGGGGVAGVFAAFPNIRSAPAPALTREVHPARVAALPTLDTLPLLPPPVLPALDSDNVNAAAIRDTSTHAVLEAAPKTTLPSTIANASTKSAQRSKKSASWTRRSEIIDPWSTHR